MDRSRGFRCREIECKTDDVIGSVGNDAVEVGRMVLDYGYDLKGLIFDL